MSTRGNAFLGPDLISSMPDPILHHILSFLNTKMACKTCVLSKRWEHLWASVHSLYFYFEEGEEEHSFIQFVNAVIRRREPFDLDTFHLDCGELDMHEHAIDCLKYAVKHRTRVLHVWNCYSLLPSCIYTCTSIEELYLSDCNVIISQTVNLPKLKKLVIERIDNPSSTENLISGCPILEYLELTYYTCSECVIALEHLKHLRIIDCTFQTLLIDAPKLLSFSYVSFFYMKCDRLDGLSPPHKVDVNMPSLMIGSFQSYWSERSDYLDFATSLLRSFSNTELLKLNFSCDQLKELCGLLLPLPVFHKLKHVTVSFYKFACLEIVAWILKSSPNLRTLTLMQDTDYFGFDETEVTTSGSIDASLMIAITACKKLEMIEVRYYDRSEMVGRLLDALIGSAKELKNLKIQFIRV